MAAYYNEIDPYAAQWLGNLIKEGLIADGEVDTRSIVDVRPDDLAGFVQCHFFAGLGGWPYAMRLAEWPDDRAVWTGSCPCQPFSLAGNRTGFDDSRHLWPEWFRLIRERRPAILFGEQVANAKVWLDLVLTELESERYACGAAVLPACSVGAPHRRDRLWFCAHSERDEQPRQEPRSGSDRRVGRQQQQLPWDGGWKQALARFRVVDNGIPRRVAATDAARNAIVPQVAAEFIGAVMALSLPSHHQHNEAK